MAQKGCGISLTFKMFLTDQLQFDFRPEKVKPKITINAVNIASIDPLIYFNVPMTNSTLTAE